jgi:hypothetical protein
MHQVLLNLLVNARVKGHVIPHFEGQSIPHPKVG